MKATWWTCGVQSLKWSGTMALFTLDFHCFCQEKSLCKDSINPDSNAFTVPKLCNTIKSQTCFDYKASGEHFTAAGIISIELFATVTVQGEAEHMDSHVVPCWFSRVTTSCLHKRFWKNLPPFDDDTMLVCPVRCEAASYSSLCPDFGEYYDALWSELNDPQSFNRTAALVCVDFCLRRLCPFDPSVPLLHERLPLRHRVCQGLIKSVLRKTPAPFSPRSIKRRSRPHGGVWSRRMHWELDRRSFITGETRPSTSRIMAGLKVKLLFSSLSSLFVYHQQHLDSLESYGGNSMMARMKAGQ